MAKTPAQITRYCLKCHYPLRGLSRNECPECSRRFDPLDPGSTAPQPWGDLRLVVAATGRVLAIGASLLSIIALIASVLHVDPLFLWLGGIATAPLMIALLTIASIPSVPLNRRTRIGALIGVLLLVSIVTTSWPFRLSFALHRSALQRQVDQIRSGKALAGRGSRRVGLFWIKRVRESPDGNIGFQLTGGAGSGTYLVNRASGSTGTWYNTNWEQDLGDGWFRVFED